MKRVGELRTEIDEARIDEPGPAARSTGSRPRSTRRSGRSTRPSSTSPARRSRTAPRPKNIPLGPGDLLLVKAEDVEIRGGDGPDVKCVVKKTVLGELGKEQDLTADFDGIELVVRKSSGKEMFGFYKTAADRPDLRHEYDQFPFKPFLDREFTVVSIKGLTHEEGNRQISVEIARTSRDRGASAASGGGTPS